MNSSELLRIRIGDSLYCRQQAICNGGTQLTPGIVTGLGKSFTLYFSYSTPNVISRVYVPPGFFSTSASSGLSNGGIFTGNVGTDLQFITVGAVTTSLSFNRTSYSTVIGMQVSGFVNAGVWQPIPGQLIGNTNVRFTVDTPNKVILAGLSATLTTGGNTTPAGAGKPLEGWQFTVTLFYL